MQNLEEKKSINKPQSLDGNTKENELKYVTELPSAGMLMVPDGCPVWR